MKHADGHGHAHGLVDPSIVRSREGVRAVSISLVVLLATTLIQIGVFLNTNSIALLADLIHNFGDALTALPLGIAFFLRSARGEKAAGYFVVAAIFVSACVALWQTIERLIDPQQLSHLGALAAAGAIGFIGNEIAALIRLRAGKRLAVLRSSPTATTHAPMDSSPSESSAARSSWRSASSSATLSSASRSR